MMDNNDIKLLHSPDKLLAGFARSRFVSCMLIAFAIHAFVFTVSSLSYIRDQLDPAGAERRRAELIESEEKEAAADKPPVESPAEPPREAVAAPEEAPPAAAVPLADDPRMDTPIMKQITELPEEGEIPEVPDTLGISIADTNPD